MAKNKTVFFCQECGYESAKWMGQCPSCKNWNTFVEEIKTAGTAKHTDSKSMQVPTSLFMVTSENTPRIGTGYEELDRVLGGGIVPGSLVLVGGDPGIGKSTLLLQVCRTLVNENYNVLYASGEESLQQIKMRAERLGGFEKDMQLICDTDLDTIENAIVKTSPKAVIIDSIQTMSAASVTSAAGSVSQVREVTGRLMQIAKMNNIAIFVVGHVTKDGMVAGPRTLEHMVDTVLYFEGERSSVYRILRGVKNRFGSTNEIGVFEMKGLGLSEVSNPSEVMLSGRPEDASGTVVLCSVEGTRPLLAEIQALVSFTNFNIPRRTAVGIDFNRVNLLMAVLEKRAGIQMGNCDAYVNLTGGLRLSEPAIDLAIVAALVSSFRNTVIMSDTVIFGEVGLAGEVRGVSMAEQRAKEAARLGFKKCIMPQANVDKIKNFKDIELIGVSNIEEMITLLNR
ncbi:MAG: DNA repair protein RadA [Lachnospiraceae bacterium]|nr:DNA repair protein RadA [Lachnospiraceae bacterium]